MCVEMSAAGVIKPSRSLWLLPVVMVSNKSLLRVNYALDGIKGSGWFSLQDLRSVLAVVAVNQKPGLTQALGCDS